MTKEFKDLRGHGLRCNVHYAMHELYVFDFIINLIYRPLRSRRREGLVLKTKSSPLRRCGEYGVLYAFP